MRDQEQRPEEKSSGAHRAVSESVTEAGAVTFGPMTPAAVLALQRAAGNLATSQLIAPDAQRDLVDAALRSPSRPIDTARRRKLESFHQTDLSGVRVHTGPVAQRSAAAIGASAYTVGTDIVLGAGAEDDETLGHETRHVKQQGEGAVAGTDNGAGLSVSDPGHAEEKEASADGAAFRAGAAHAPSATARPGGGPPGQHSVQRMAKDGEEDTDTDEQDKPPDKKKSKASLTKPVKDVLEENTLAYGGGRHGRVTDEVRLRFPRSKEQERAEQSLSHLSLLLHDTMRGVQDELAATRADAAKVNDREVQGMLINDRLLFASNFNESIDRLRERFGARMATLRELLRVRQSDQQRTRGLLSADANEYLERLKRAEAKINAEFDGARTADNATAEAMRQRMDAPVMIVDAEASNMHDLLTNPDHAGRVIMLRFGATDRDTANGVRSTSMHAEQKLLVAIARAGLKPDEAKSPIVIGGKYRPCVGCAAALRYYQDIGGFSHLRYNINAGHYYQESVNTLATHLRHVVQDENYLTYVRESVDQRRSAAMSTAALAGQSAPEGAKFDNGYEVRLPAEEAGGRGYVTDSDSEAEETKRDFQPYSAAAGGRKLGKGGKVPAGRRGHRVTTDEEKARLRNAWDNRDTVDPAPLFQEFYRRRGPGQRPVTQAEISEVTGASPRQVYLAISGRTGHESRDDSAPDPNRKRMPQRGKKSGEPKKPRGKGAFKKGKNLDTPGEREINNAIENDPSFRRLWLNEENTAKPKIKPTAMSTPLEQLIAGLRDTYSISSMAKLLRMSEDALRKHLNRKYQSVNAKPGTQEPEDVDMLDADQPASDVEMELDEPPGPEFHDYLPVDDEWGQITYIDQNSGLTYLYLDGRMVLMLEEQETVPTGPVAGSSRTSYVPWGPPVPQPADSMDMDVDTPAENDDDNFIYTSVGKGKQRARRRD